MNLNMYENRWCAVQVRPRYEATVSTILRTKGYEEFLPMYSVKRQWSDRRKQIVLPLFLGYVFCRFNSKIRGSIVTTPGVVRILGRANEISVIDDKEIEAIQLVLKAGMKVEPHPHAKIGERVRIASGPLNGIEGIVTGYKNRNRLILSVDLIQSSVSLEIDGHLLELVAGRASDSPCSATQASPHTMTAVNSTVGSGASKPASPA